jgi:hypothetical protein
MFESKAQFSSFSQSAQVSKPFDFTQFLISHSEQCANLTPASRHPVQLIISGVMSGLNAAFHLSAVWARNTSSFVRVAIRASHETQFIPQQAISFCILI